MTTVSDEAALARGYEGLASGDWDDARDAFQEALAATDSPEALDGLGRALWWLRDERGAVVHRERAYAGFRRDGELARAARIALWLSREYGLAFDNDAASRGWLARAERLLRDVAPGRRAGLARSRRAPKARATLRLRRRCASALSTSRSPRRDADLELRALAQLGLAEVTLGDVESGLDPARRGDGGGDERRARHARDVRGHLLHADARLRARRRQRASATVERGSRRVRPRARPRHAARLLPDVLRRRLSRRTDASTPPRRSSSWRCASSRLQDSVRAASLRPRAWRRFACSRVASTRPSSCSRASRTSPRRCRPAWRFASRAASRPRPRRS